MIQKLNIEAIAKEDCSGCTACEAVCPVKAISMVPDSQGFRYPVINHDKCVDCGICHSACPAVSGFTSLAPLAAYATKHRDENDRLSSTSGGFAAALAEDVVGRGGVAYGVVLDENVVAVTRRIDSADALDALKGSKYVQTDLRDTFSLVADDLSAGSEVTFFASSCHVDGLLSFLKRKKISADRLVTVDYICHGVPSPRVFRDYIDFMSRKKAVRTFLFRTKKKGWGFGSATFAPTIVFKDGSEESDTARTRAYQQLFFSNNCLRPHCFKCPYAGRGRVADFTMADYWGLKDAHPDFFDPKGVSLVLVNTEKGKKMFVSLDSLVSIPTDLSKASARQGNMHGPSSKAATYDQFWNDYESLPFRKILNRYTSISFVCKVRRRLLKLLKL